MTAQRVMKLSCDGCAAEKAEWEQPGEYPPDWHEFTVQKMITHNTISSPPQQRTMHVGPVCWKQNLTPFKLFSEEYALAKLAADEHTRLNEELDAS